jgi:hypothetical protein
MVGRKERYLISLHTKCNGFATYLPLVQGAFDRLAQQRLIAFADYLKSSSPLPLDSSRTSGTKELSEYKYLP